jgi:hypothetical protein
MRRRGRRRLGWPVPYGPQCNPSLGLSLSRTQNRTRRAAHYTQLIVIRAVSDLGVRGGFMERAPLMS